MAAMWTQPAATFTPVSPATTNAAFSGPTAFTKTERIVESKHHTDRVQNVARLKRSGEWRLVVHPGVDSEAEQHTPSNADANLYRRLDVILPSLRIHVLEGFERRYPHELSGGQQQRVGLSRALAQNPVVLLLDEPFSNLDPDMAGRMRQELHDLLRRTKTTTVLVTHDHDEAFAMADRIAVLNQGRLEQFDTPEMTYHMPATPFVADFVGQADFIPGIVSQGMVHTELGEFPDTIECKEGTAVVVMIRPDDIHLVPTEGSGSRVLSRQFHGSENLYTVSLPSGQIVHSSQGSTSVYQAGTTVELRVLATHTVLFRREESTG